MIDISKTFRNELNKGLRSGVSCDISVSRFNKNIKPYKKYQPGYAKLNVNGKPTPKITAYVSNNSSDRDSELSNICKKENGEYEDSVNYIFDVTKEDTFTDFASSELDTYDVTTKKVIYRPRNDGEKIDESEAYKSYSKLYDTRIIAKDVYLKKPIEENYYFKKTIYFNRNTTEDFIVSGITMVFGRNKDIYPTKIVTSFFDENGSQISDNDIFLPTSNRISQETNKMFTIKNPHKMVIRVYGMSKFGVRFRLTSLFFGMEQFIGDNLIKASTQRIANPMSTELPKNEITFDFFDKQAQFDPQNPNNISDDVIGMTVRQYYSYGSETFLAGTYCIRTSPTQKDSVVTIKAESEVFSKICEDDEAEFNFFLPSSLNNFVEEILKFKGHWDSPKLAIPEFSQQNSYGYLKGSKVKDAFVKILNSAFAIAYEDPNGQIEIRQTQAPGVFPTKIHNLCTNLIIDSPILDTSVAPPKEIKIQEYMTTIKAADHYQRKAEKYQIYGNVNGNFFIDNNLVIGAVDEATGEKPSIVVNESHAKLLYDSFNWWVKGTQKYEIPYFSDPTIEVGDFVSFTDKYNKKLYGVVAANQYSYPESIGSDKLVIYTIKNTKPTDYGGVGIWLQDESGNRLYVDNVLFEVYNSNGKYCQTIATKDGIAKFMSGKLPNNARYGFKYVGGLENYADYISYSFERGIHYVNVDTSREDKTGWLTLTLMPAGAFGFWLRTPEGSYYQQAGVRFKITENFLYDNKDVNNVYEDTRFIIETNKLGYTWYGVRPDINPDDPATAKGFRLETGITNSIFFEYDGGLASEIYDISDKYVTNGKPNIEAIEIKKGKISWVVIQLVNKAKKNGEISEKN